MNHHPLTQNGRPDRRYSINREWCGYPELRYVARFDGEFISQSLFYSSALVALTGYRAKRDGALVFTEIKA